MFKPTHTITNQDDIIEVVLHSILPNYIWCDANGNTFCIAPTNAMLIPNMAVAAEERLSYLQNKSAVAVPKTALLDDGRIVRANGMPWAIKSTAIWVLGQLGLNYTHTVDGFGNSSASGRQWWIRPRRTISWEHGWVDHGTDQVININYPYSIEANVWGCDEGSKSRLIWELKEIKKEWNARFIVKDFIVMFGWDGDYTAFKKLVCGL